MERLRTTGSFHPRPDSERNRICMKDQALNIIAYFLNNPHTSIRVANEALGLFRKTTSRELNRHNSHLFCVHGFQWLQPSDFGRRVEFCNWLLINQDIDPNFVMNILWTDECLFLEDGAINTYNDHY